MKIVYAFLLCLCVGIVASGAASNWYLLADDAKLLAPDTIEAAMPVYQRFDASASAKPTLLVTVPITIPASVQSCTSLALDIPLYRIWNDTTTPPFSVTLYQWRTQTPVGSWVYASRQSEAAISIAADPPANPNNTWSPRRDRGVYRFVFSLATPVAGNTIYWPGLFFSLNNTADGNAIYWLGRCCETNMSLGLGRMFGYIDLNGFISTSGTAMFRYAPTGTEQYALNGQNISLVALTAYMNCQPMAGTGQPAPRLFTTLPAPTWDAAGTVPPSPSFWPSPIVIGPSPMPPTPPPQSPPASGVISLPYITPIMSPVNPTPAAPRSTIVIINNNNGTTPSSSAVDPITGWTSVSWFIAGLAGLAVAVVAIVVAVIYVVWQRWRLHRRPYTQMPPEPDDNRAIELTPRAAGGDGTSDSTTATESVISQPPELIVLKKPGDMEQVQLDAPPPQSSPNLRPRDTTEEGKK